MNKKAGYVFLFAVAALCSEFSSAEEAKCMKNKNTVIILRDNGNAVKATGNTKVTGTWSSLGKQYQLGSSINCFVVIFTFY